jgi:hypothetical protein
MARVAPTAMVFVPCVDGISHNEIEDAKPEDLTAGCAVLLNALLDTADAAAHHLPSDYRDGTATDHHPGSDSRITR